MNASKAPALAAIIGAGPAGLFAAETLAAKGVSVHIYDSKPSAGRKFLIAGKGGLNLTHSEPLEQFMSRYGSRQQQLASYLRSFGPNEIRQWAQALGIETFIGSSGRVFPVGLKAYPLLKNWLSQLQRSDISFHFNHSWHGWLPNGNLLFDSPTGPLSIDPCATILALGGASWPMTGSTGAWVPILQDRGVPVSLLRPANCGFNVAWDNYFRSRFAGTPVKAVALSLPFSKHPSTKQRGEFMITEYGLEGSLIYAHSASIRDEISSQGTALLHIDIAPDWELEEIIERLSTSRGSRSMASHLEKTVHLRGVKAGLLRQVLSGADLTDIQKTARTIKQLPLQVLSPRPIEEAISCAGGVEFSALDENLMLTQLPGVFIAGEMLDWEAPTGGYLLTACFSTGRAAALGASRWLATTRAP